MVGCLRGAQGGLWQLVGGEMGSVWGGSVGGLLGGENG